MNDFRIDLFGPPALIAGNRRLQTSSRKTMALLAYLATRARQPVTRSHLGGLLWGDSAEEQARTNLRQALTQLRKLFRDVGTDPIEADREQVVLTDAGHQLVSAQSLAGLDANTLIRLAQGPGFLEGFSAQARGFDEWLNSERHAFEAALRTRLSEIAVEKQTSGDLATASAALGQALKIDPLDEELHRRQMRVLAALGRTDVALRQFESCRQLLGSQLNVEPDRETRRVASEIRASREARAQKTSSEALALVQAGASEDFNVQFFEDVEAALGVALAASVSSSPPRAQALVAGAQGKEAAIEAAWPMLPFSENSQPILNASLVDRVEYDSRFSFIQVEQAGRSLVRGIPAIRSRTSVDQLTDQPAPPKTSQNALMVLPLRDLSPQAQELSLGLFLSQELTAKLSRYGTFLVSSPTAAQRCRRLDLEPEEIREQLGVGYLADGTVIRIGGRLRISMTVTRLSDEAIIVSETFEGPIDEMFDQQGEMVARIAISIAQNTEAAEISRVERALTADMGAFDWYLRGLTEYRRAGLKIQHARVAAQCFDTALTLDPEFPRVLATRLCCMSWFDSDIYFDSKSDRDLSLALKIDDRDPEVHRMIGGIAAMKRQYEVAIHHVERAVHLNSSDAYLLSTAAGVLAWSGEERRALEHINRALTLDPFLPVWAIDEQIFVLYTLGDYDGALAAFRKLSIPASRALTYAAASLVALGDIESARSLIARLKKNDPEFSRSAAHLLDYHRDPEQTKALMARLEQAGLT